MEMTILVTYASRNGATREIAERIGGVLRRAGLEVDVAPVDTIRSLSPYQAVILGSAIYIGKWQKDATVFLQENAQALADRPTWLFASGPTGLGDPVSLVEGKILPANLEPLVERIHPRAVAIFHGCIAPEKISFIEKSVIKGMHKPFGDFRDWEMIETWAAMVAAQLAAQSAAQAAAGLSLEMNAARSGSLIHQPL
ncbi:MAG TPA: flavodoxin domain-containing protein [Anaerolineales bacterium]|nr:flavodoxin domain-containing protein [Anaerolineales bacterium]